MYMTNYRKTELNVCFDSQGMVRFYCGGKPREGLPATCVAIYMRHLLFPHEKISQLLVIVIMPPPQAGQNR